MPTLLTETDQNSREILAQRAPRQELESGTGFRLIPRIETDPQVIAFAQTFLGKITLLAVFGLVLSQLGNSWLLKLVLVASTTFFPRARRLIVTAGTLLLTDFFWFDRGSLSTVAAHHAASFSRVAEFLWIMLPFILFCATLMWASARFPRSVVARHPLLILLGICSVVLATAYYAPFAGFARFAIWAFFDTFCLYIWYLAYAMSDCASPRGDSPLLQAGTFHPFWGSTNVPYPKGASYWRTIEAQTSTDLAVTMIKGVKLIVWCFLLRLLQTYYVLLIHNKLGIPAGSECIQAFELGKPLAWEQNWLSWPDGLILELFSISIFGHTIIATCRMAGFRALRNTYCPLSSRTIAEYWNRYYFYFKELLVDMFYYPTFLRCFKKHRKLRTFFATFVAASLGNTLYHLMRALGSTISFGMLGMVRSFESYFFYSILLAVGIGFSQLRHRKPLGSRGWFREKILAPACVVGFYCFLNIFWITSPMTGLRYFGFLLRGR